jgi:hypothetical protein
MNILRPYLPHLQNPVPVSLKNGEKKKQAAEQLTKNNLEEEC